jgi:hypothetical protein
LELNFGISVDDTRETVVSRYFIGTGIGDLIIKEVSNEILLLLERRAVDWCKHCEAPAGYE